MSPPETRAKLQCMEVIHIPLLPDNLIENYIKSTSVNIRCTDIWQTLGSITSKQCRRF